MTSQRKDLQDRLYQALEQIDALPNLADYVSGLSPATPTIDRAFAVWSRTALATYRLTSSVELYNSQGDLVSRFSLMPEPTTRRHETASCNWEVFEEVLPFGSLERHVPQAGRGICDHGVVRGAIVVRTMLDYRALPFFSSQNPYLESLRPDSGTAAEGLQGNDVEFVGYGWSRAPTYVSGTGVWPLPDEAFARAVASRQGFWTTLSRDDERFRVYLASDRGGIYALGYPAMTWFGHLVNLAELVVLAGALYVVLRRGRRAVRAGGRHRILASGRALLREFRSSFYRKLFLAFVAGAVVPVAILAFATRTYFAAQARAGVEEAAVRTATVAQRLVEDYATVLSGAAGPDVDRRSDHGAGQPRHRSGREPVRAVQPRGDERARSVRLASAVAPDAQRGRTAASCSNGCRRSSASNSWRTRRTCRLPPRSAPADARASSPCPCRSGSWRSSGRSTNSIGRSSSARCCSACSAPASATGWPSGSPIPSTG